MKKIQVEIFQHHNISKLEENMNDWLNNNDVIITNITQSGVLDNRFSGQINALTTITLLYYKNKKEDKTLLTD